MAESAAALLTDVHYVSWARRSSTCLAERTAVAGYAVDAARLVPAQALPKGLSTTPAFRKASGALRGSFGTAARDLRPGQPRYEGAVAVRDADLAGMSDAERDRLVANADIDFGLPAVAEFPATRAAAVARLKSFVEQDLARYPWRRNNPADATGVSTLSPYLHFGLIGPREIPASVRDAETYAKSKWWYLDEVLTWREYFHYKAFHQPDLHRFEALPDRPRQSLLDHSNDLGYALPNLETLIHGRSDDQTWNAAQRQSLLTGYMHNNLRMYRGKQLIKWTSHPAAVWDLACYLNDRLSLNGRDPATYRILQWVSGASKPAWHKQPIYGRVAPKTDRALRKRNGFAEWAADWSTRDSPAVGVPERVPTRNEDA